MAAIDFEQAVKQAYCLVAYQESEQSDKNASEDEFDALWQSIYDVCTLVHFDILDELLTEEEYMEAVTWLKDYQHLTKAYQDKELEL